MYNLIISVSCFFILFIPSFLSAEIIDRVVAVVNDEVITLSEFNEESRDTLQRIADQAPPSELAGALQNARRDILSRMIDRKITVQKAEEMNISVNDAEIDGALESILARNKATREDLNKELAARGITEAAYRTSLREQILFSRLVSYEVNSKVVITEEKARQYYDTRYMRELPVNGYYLLQIGLGGSGGRETKEAVRKKALEIREAAINGQSFNQLAATYSDLPSAVDGGDIGVVKENEMAPDMLKGVQALQPGDISPVMETPAGFIFFKLLGVNRDGTIIRAPFDSIKEEIFSLLRNEEQERLYSNWVKELREEAYIKELL